MLEELLLPAHFIISSVFLNCLEELSEEAHFPPLGSFSSPYYETGKVSCQLFPSPLPPSHFLERSAVATAIAGSSCKDLIYKCRTLIYRHSFVMCLTLTAIDFVHSWECLFLPGCSGMLPLDAVDWAQKSAEKCSGALMHLTWTSRPQCGGLHWCCESLQMWVPFLCKSVLEKKETGSWEDWLTVQTAGHASMEFSL